MRAWLAAAAAVVACKAKESPSGQGSAPPPTRQPIARPSQQALMPMPALELPPDAKRDAKIALGRRLFFDKRLSGHGDRACDSCHQNEDGTGGHDPLATGSARHAPTLWNVGYYKAAFNWDGEAKTLGAAAVAAWASPMMGLGVDNVDKKAAELAALPDYKPQLADAFGTGKITVDQIAEALAEYERTLICKDTAYDRFAAGDKSALTEQQQRGLDVFLGKGQCVICHAPPYFSTAMNSQGGVYFNAGIGTGVPEDKVDIGRMKVTDKPQDWATFKPPSLRNITKSPPYFHDGSVARLEDAVKLMAGGGIPNKNLNPVLVDRKLSDAERVDLIAFLGGLDCPGKLEP